MQSANLQKVCKKVKDIETNANVLQKDFAVWNVDDEEGPLHEYMANLIQKVFVEFQTVIEVLKKDNACGFLTMSDSQQLTVINTLKIE